MAAVSMFEAPTPTEKSTEELLRDVLTIAAGQPYVFYTEVDMGERIVQRIRVCLSRERKKLRDEGILLKSFKLVAKTKTLKKWKIDKVVIIRDEDDMLNDLKRSMRSSFLKELSLDG